MVSSCSIMVLHGFRSKKARHAEKQKYRLHQTTSHSSLLVASQGDVSRKLNQAFLLVASVNFNFVDEKRSDICICAFHIYIYILHIVVKKYAVYMHIYVYIYCLYDVCQGL